MEAKISTMSVHQDIRSRINRHKPERFTHRREEGRSVAVIVLSHWLVTICFSCCCKRGRACLAFFFFFFTSCTMPLVLLFNFVLHTNQIKSSLSQQSCSDFFTFLNQAVSSVSTSLYCSPQWQLCWRVVSMKLTQQTEDDRHRNQHTHSLSQPSKRLITETWNLLSFS